MGALERRARCGEPRDLIETNFEYRLDVTFSKRLRRELGAATRQMFQPDRQKIPHFFERGANPIELAEIHQIGGKDPVAERRQFLRKPIRLGGIGDLPERLHQKCAAKQ